MKIVEVKIIVKIKKLKIYEYELVIKIIKCLDKIYIIKLYKNY